MLELGSELAPTPDPNHDQVATTGAAAALRLSLKDGVGNSTAGGRGGGTGAGARRGAGGGPWPHFVPILAHFAANLASHTGGGA